MTNLHPRSKYRHKNDSNFQKHLGTEPLITLCLPNQKFIVLNVYAPDESVCLKDNPPHWRISPMMKESSFFEGKLSGRIEISTAVWIKGERFSRVLNEFEMISSGRWCPGYLGDGISVGEEAISTFTIFWVGRHKSRRSETFESIE